MAACGVLVLGAVLGGALWGDTELRIPETEESPVRLFAGFVARRYPWYLTLAVVSGVGSGVLAAGAGGRLAMRLLAATAGDAAQGPGTEAQEIVGRSFVGGTIGFVVFTALLFGLATASRSAAYRSATLPSSGTPESALADTNAAPPNT